jgi:serine/threonine protein kinase
MNDDSRYDGSVTRRLAADHPDAGTVSEPSSVTRRLPEDVPVTRVLPETEPGQHSPFRTTRLDDSFKTSTLSINGEPAKAYPEGSGGNFTRVLNENGNQSHAAHSFLVPGDMVADRYEVLRPIGGDTGEADVFVGKDHSSATDIVIKYYRPALSPKKHVLQQLRDLAHPDIVQLLDYGDWGGRFFEILEFCKGGSVIDYAPLTEEDVKGFLPEIVSGLNACHSLGIIHRDIKPNNLFFRQPGKNDLVIGDFGVSSVFDVTGDVRTTKTWRFRTLHYAAPELLNQRQIGPKTDYYALGVTLIHLLTGKSPFDGWDDEAVYGAHFRGEVPLPSGVSEQVLQLLKGLLRYNCDRRWGFNQVTTWARKETILADDGRPDYDDLYAGKSIPHSRVPEATTPVELARHLHAFDAAEELFRGRISKWVSLFDAKLADRIDEIVDNYAAQRSLGVFKLRYVLDSTSPLDVAGKEVHTVDQFVDLLRTADKETFSAVADLFWQTQLECWIEAVHTDSQSRDLVKKIKGIRERLLRDYADVKSDIRRRLGVLSLRWLLDPAFPLQLSEGVEISRPDELETALSLDSELIEVLHNHLFGGIFEEWITQCFPDRREDIDFIAKCRKQHANNPELGAYALRWRFNPDMPFLFYPDTHAKTPAEIAELIDQNQRNWNQGCLLLSKGWIREWLAATGRLANPAEFDNLMNHGAMSLNCKMEAVQHLLNPDLSWPRIGTDKTAMHLGGVSVESSRSTRITFRNTGRGFMVGSFRLTGGGMGFAINQETFEGGPITVEVAADARGLPGGSTQHATLIATANGSSIEVPLSFRAGAPWLQMIARSLVAGAICSAFFGIMRVVIGSSMGMLNGKSRWFSYDNVNKYWSNHGEIILWAFILLIGVGGGLYYLIRMGNARKAPQG